MIEKYLKKYNLRILGNKKWLVWDENTLTWIVCGKTLYTGGAHILYDGNELSTALSILVEEQQ
jgi:hypothetical protein